MSEVILPIWAEIVFFHCNMNLSEVQNENRWLFPAIRRNRSVASKHENNNRNRCAIVGVLAIVWLQQLTVGPGPTRGISWCCWWLLFSSHARWQLGRFCRFLWFFHWFLDCRLFLPRTFCRPGTCPGLYLSCRQDLSLCEPLTFVLLVVLFTLISKHKLYIFD